MARIKTAAELLFADQGYDGTTLRQVTQKAGVNLAAVNYHYYDKESLYKAVVGERMRLIDQDRLAQLDRAEREAVGGPVALAHLFEIMAAPLFTLNSGCDSPFARLFGRCLTEPQSFMPDLVSREFEPTMARFAQALRRHAPALSPEDFLWRLSFVVGALHHSLATLHRMRELTGGICRSHDGAGALSRYVQFATSVFSPRLDQQAIGQMPSRDFG